MAPVPTEAAVAPDETLAPGPTETPMPVPTETPMPAPTSTAVSQPSDTWTPAPTTTKPPPRATGTSVPQVGDLKATVVAGLPPTPTPETEDAIWGDIAVLPLEVGDGAEPLWAAFTVGMYFYDWEQGHLVALYTYDQQGWQELGRVMLTDCAEHVDENSLKQVQVEPSRIWLEMESYAGAHSGCYDLLSYDGETLRHEVSHFNSSPGAGQLRDLDGDGTLEAILNWTENYVFCYACGVRLPLFEVLRWDGEQMANVELSPLPESAPPDLKRLNDRAVELAWAMLWKDAQALIAEAAALDPQDPTVAWNAILIDMHAEALAAQVGEEGYPLLANAFYGDYAAALDVMRPYGVLDIWRPDSPLIVGTMAEGWELTLSDWLSGTTNAALEAEPELAPAYFLRGWAVHLADPADPAGLADVGRAAELDPSEPLFAQSLAYLGGGTSLAPTAPATPEPTRTPAATPTPAVGTEERWEVRTLLAGPGQPGRLYALLADSGLSGGPAERVRFLISDDYGQTWAPFPGGLPSEECFRNVNLDYATSDALYASTCQGLYRWSGGQWVFVSPLETGMVAVVYGQPEVLWATGSFESGAGVYRSDDAGGTWTPRGRGLISFNGVANLGIDPREANTLYAIIWPKYAGSYLRRGTADGEWQTMPTPLDNSVIDTGMTLDGATGAMYVIVTSPAAQLWRTSNPDAPDLNDVQWELVHDFGPDAMVSLLASGWSPEGLALYANVWPLYWKEPSLAEVGDPLLHRSLDGGRTWTPLPIP